MTASAKGRSARRKGRDAQCDAAKVLTERDWSIVETSAGKAVEDIVATDPQGITWSVEVKNRKIINLGAFRKQAMEQANRRKLPWMLMVKIYGENGAYLIQRKNCNSAVWRRK